MQTKKISNIISVLLLGIMSFPISAHDDNEGYGCWGGIYAGAQLGWGWSHTKWSYTNANFFNTAEALVLGKDFSVHTNGAIEGIFLGVNYQIQQWIYGIETSISNMNHKKENSSPFFPGNDFYTTNIRSYATIKGRIGYAENQGLAYFSAGWAGAKIAVTLDDIFNNIVASSSPWMNGWVVGIGMDYALVSYFIAGLSYEFINLNKSNAIIPCSACGEGIGGGAPSVDNNTTAQMLMLKFSYLLNI